MEELKMIVEVISKVSGDAQTVLIIYFVKDFLTSILVTSTILGLVFIIVKAIYKLTGYYEVLKNIMQDVNNFSYDPDSQKDRAELFNNIKKLKENK